MTCRDASDRLPGLLYDDLPAEEADRLRAHLRGCAACRREFAALAGVRRLLGAAPAPAAEVDLPRLYREAGRRSERSRGRQTLLVSLVAAAALLAVALPRLELRFEAHQLVVRWGAPPEAAPPPVAAVPAGVERDLAGQRAEVEALRHQLARLRLDVEKDVAALYAAQFATHLKGETQ